MAKTMVFLVSAFFHELVISVALRFIFPALFTLFLGSNFILSLTGEPKHRILGNLFVMFFIGAGVSFTVTMYNLEASARRNCPLTEDPIWALPPRFQTCGCFI